MEQPEEILDADSPLSLSEFLTEIKNTLDKKFKGFDGYWVRGELSEWRKSGSHYYGELVEHDENTQLPVAKARVNLWGSVANKLLMKFKDATGSSIESGMKVLLFVQVNYNIQHGLSLNIRDIDPKFTLGDREARRIKIINDLRVKKILNNNKSLPLPIEFTNVAVISSENAAGLGDFFAEAKLLMKYNLCNFDVYNAKMQGQECVTSVSAQLREIYKRLRDKSHQYDCIVLIRGGGSQADLDWLNYFEIANALCYMPIPVFIGIGHERDKSVLDEIALKSFDTPSKVISHIKNMILDNSKKAQSEYNSISQISSTMIASEQTKASQHIKDINSNIIQLVKQQRRAVADYYTNTFTQSKQLLLLQHEITSNNYKTVVQRFTQNTELSKTHLNNINQKIYQDAKNICLNQITTVNDHKENLNISSKRLSVYNSERIKSMYKHILSLSIEPTLSRGFALVKTKDKYIASAVEANKHADFTIMFNDGEINMERPDD